MNNATPVPSTPVPTLALIATGAAVHTTFLLQVIRPDTFSGLVFLLAVLTPWLLLLAAHHVAARRSGPQAICTWTSVAYLLLGAWAYWDTLYVHPDPQGGLVFFAVPVMGGIAAVVLLAVSMIRKIG